MSGVTMTCPDGEGERALNGALHQPVPGAPVARSPKRPNLIILKD